MLGRPDFFAARVISRAWARFIASGFSHRIILPAAAAAIAISWCVLLGEQMSIASISGDSTSLRQSVSTRSHPHRAAKASAFSRERAATAFKTGRYATSKNWFTRW